MQPCTPPRYCQLHADSDGHGETNGPPDTASSGHQTSALALGPCCGAFDSRLAALRAFGGFQENLPIEVTRRPTSRRPWHGAELWRRGLRGCQCLRGGTRGTRPPPQWSGTPCSAPPPPPCKCRPRCCQCHLPSLRWSGGRVGLWSEQRCVCVWRGGARSATSLQLRAIVSAVMLRKTSCGVASLSGARNVGAAVMMPLSALSASESGVASCCHQRRA
jgi:hypothetical protein